MNEDEMRAEILRLREHTQYLAKSMAQQFGRYDAAVSALLGALSVVGSNEAIRQAVDLHLEKRQAMDLGGNVSQDAVDSFAELAELIRLAMRAAVDQPPQS
jgi:AICAR transformylase/IMP cyclohydrolase PurH